VSVISKLYTLNCWWLCKDIKELLHSMCFLIYWRCWWFFCSCNFKWILAYGWQFLSV